LPFPIIVIRITPPSPLEGPRYTLTPGHDQPPYLCWEAPL
jgi:hypothetical protein